jgi:hypothetical protein
MTRDSHTALPARHLLRRLRPTRMPSPHSHDTPLPRIGPWS